MASASPILKVLLLAMSLAYLCARGSSASELHYYEHNLSVMAVAFVGPNIRISYETPRPGLASAGVKEGTVLFQGFDDGGILEGVAYAFKEGCSPAPYKVIGSIKKDVIVLKGPGPVRSGGILVG